jgi:hypothetical protein
MMKHYATKTKEVKYCESKFAKTLQGIVTMSYDDACRLEKFYIKNKLVERDNGYGWKVTHGELLDKKIVKKALKMMGASND